MKSKRIAAAAILLAIALIIGLIEGALPPILPPLPYAKLGLSNLIVLFSLIVLNWKYSAVIVVLKCLIIGIFSGKISGILYSLPAGIIALVTMQTLLFTKKFSLTGVSATSGIMHNFTQVCVAAIITKSSAVFAYLPYLALFGAVAGGIVGFATYYLIKVLPQKSISKLF